MRGSRAIRSTATWQSNVIRTPTFPVTARQSRICRSAKSRSARWSRSATEINDPSIATRRFGTRARQHALQKACGPSGFFAYAVRAESRKQHTKLVSAAGVLQAPTTPFSSSDRIGTAQISPAREWIGLFPHFGTTICIGDSCSLVPVEGIEPPLLAEHDFESRASTNSATRASGADHSGGGRGVNAMTM